MSIEINELDRYWITTIKSPLSCVNFAMPCKIVDDGDDFRIANIHFVEKNKIQAIDIEQGKIVIQCKNNDFISLTLSEEHNS